MHLFSSYHMICKYFAFFLNFHIYLHINEANITFPHFCANQAEQLFVINKHFLLHFHGKVNYSI